jgi:hypothetical protein
MRLHHLFEREQSREELKKMQRIYAKMQENPAVIDELWKTVSTMTAAEGGELKNRILVAVDPKNTGAEQDQTYAEGFIEGLVNAIDKTEGTTEERIAFAKSLGKVSHIDTNALLQPLSGWGDWLVGSEFAKRLFETLFLDPAFLQANKGPGEFALAILSPDISLTGAKGDIQVNGKPIEVKSGKTSSGGRLTPTDGTLGQLYKNAEFWRDLVGSEDETGLAGILAGVNKVNANTYTQFLEKYNLDNKQSTQILTAIFKHPGALPLAQKIGSMGTNAKASDLIKLAVKNYGASQGDDHFLILQKDIRASLYFDVDNLDPVISRLSFSLPLIDSDARSQGKAQIGILKKAR